MTSDFERSFTSGQDTRCENINAHENRMRYAEPFQNNLYLVFLVNMAIRIRDTDDVATLRDIASLLMSLRTVL